MVNQSDVEVDVAAAGAPKKRTFKKFNFRGVDLDALLDMSTDELVKLFTARARRRFQRGLKRKPMALIKKLRKAETKITFYPFSGVTKELKAFLSDISGAPMQVPVAKVDDKWIADSDVITQTVEEKFTDPSLVIPPEKASVGSNIFSTYIGFLRSKDANDGTEQAFLNELSAFNDYIKENVGPKLYHMEIALGHYKKWSVPDSLPLLKTYMKKRVEEHCKTFH
ncbi:putative glutathione dehydrogenase (ascorbate) [Helianthus debilis subsp. tardiflorus]